MRTLKSLSIALLLFCFMVAGTTTASAVNPFKPVKPKTQRIRVKTPRPKVLPIFEKSTKNNVKRGTLRERLQERREQIRKGKIDKGKKNTNCSQTCTSKSQRRFTKEPVLNTELSEKNKELIKAAEEFKRFREREQKLDSMHKSWPVMGQKQVTVTPAGNTKDRSIKIHPAKGNSWYKNRENWWDKKVSEAERKANAPKPNISCGNTKNQPAQNQQGGNKNTTPSQNTQSK